MRRRSQRSALGKVTSKPRSVSAAASMLAADLAATATASMVVSKPGILEARKSGNRLNVVCPWGQYHRAMRRPCGVTRA